MNQNRTIYGGRIEQARKLAGFTQKELAERAGVNQSAVAFYEKEKTTPSEDVLRGIAEATGFLPSFFEREPFDDFPKGSLSYRAFRSVTAKEEDKAYLNAKLMFEHLGIMAQSFLLPKVQLPLLKEKPDNSAEITRSALGLSPDTPINNLTFTLEQNGVLILPLPVYIDKIDAFSTWVNLQDERKPLIAECFGKPGDRIRFSIAHEVGHLVLHHPPKNSVKGMEKEANEFAAALLMPKQIMREEFITPVTLYSLAQMKVKWRVSMQALILRAKSLRIITERQATYLFTQMSSRGWRKAEPSNLNIPVEKPQLFRKLIEGLYDNPDEYSVKMDMNNNRGAGIALLV
ncbi:helix-turn-helix domain-containing protein [Chloroflexota bacterium]